MHPLTNIGCCSWSSVNCTTIIMLHTQSHILSYSGRNGLAVTCLTAVWNVQGSNPTVSSCMFFVKTTTIHRLGHGLHTLTAVPRSTQPSNLYGMVKWVSVYWVIIINGDGGCGFWQPTGGLTARVIWPRLRVGRHLMLFHIHHMNRVNSRGGSELWWQHHVIIIIITLLLLLLLSVSS